jgi:CARDB
LPGGPAEVSAPNDTPTSLSPASGRPLYSRNSSRFSLLSERMKRIALLTSLAALAAALAASAALAAASTVTSPPRYGAHLQRCHHALLGIDRYLSVAAGMHARPGTRRMAIRFELLVRRPGEAGPTIVRDPSFGRWFRSKPGVGTYRYFRTVDNLDAPAVYRVRVGFRWYDRRGRTQRTAFRSTRACAQPDLRPELRVRNVDVRPGRAGHDVYTVAVRNAGRTAAGPFDVALAFDATTARAKPVPGLAAGAILHVRFGGEPACDALAPPVVTVDSSGAVDESNEGNDTVTVACPAP